MKTLKRVLSMAMALMLLVGGLVVLPQEAKADGFTAKMSYASGDWGASVWGDTEGTQAVVNGEGTYSFSWDTTATASGAAVFVVDIEGAGEAYKGWSVKDVKIILDGTELAVDESKIVVGDTEEKGNYRISFFNSCNDKETTDTAAAPFDYAALTFSSKLEVSFTLTSESGLNKTFGAYEAGFSFASADWGASIWGDSDTTKTSVNGEGTYSFSWEPGVTVTGAQVFVVDIKGAGEAYNGWSIKDVKLVLDGTELVVDASKIVVGDTEEKGNYRISFFNPNNDNEIGDTAAAPFDYAALTFSKIELTFTLTSEAGLNTTFVPETGDDTPAATFDPNGKYNAYIGFQTPSYSFRNEWNEANYGSHTDYFNQVTGWLDNEAVKKDGKFTDVVIAGNGTYKVALTDIGEWLKSEIEASASGTFNLLFVSTDIPYSEDVVVSDVKFIVDGKVVHTDKEGYVDPESAEYIKILVQNTYGTTKNEISFYNAPTSTMEIEFTISGFAYDKETGDVNEPTSEPGTTQPDDNTSTQTPDNSVLPIIIGVVVVVAVVAVVVVVLKNKKTN